MATDMYLVQHFGRGINLRVANVTQALSDAEVAALLREDDEVVARRQALQANIEKLRVARDLLDCREGHILAIRRLVVAAAAARVLAQRHNVRLARALGL